MAFVKGEAYDREYICAELNAANRAERRRAVLLDPTGAIVGIVVKKDGGPEGYKNALPGKTWVMEGKEDDRGGALVTAGEVPLFFAHDDRGYRFEGMYRCTSVRRDLGPRPVYMFVRV